MKDAILVIGCAHMAYAHGVLRSMPGVDVYHVYGQDAIRLATTYEGKILVAVTESYHPVYSGLHAEATRNGQIAGQMLIQHLRNFRPETTFVLINGHEQQYLHEDDHVIFFAAPGFRGIGDLREVLRHRLHHLSEAA